MKEDNRETEQTAQQDVETDTDITMQEEEDAFQFDDNPNQEDCA